MKNSSQYILEKLQFQKRVIVPAFGVFSIETSGAQLNNENKSILPPSEWISFSKNFEEQDQTFVTYLASEKNISEESALHELQIQVDFWKKKIAAKEEFSIPELGNFSFQNSNLVFEGKRLPSETPDFFGLEEIVFSEIKNKPQEIASKESVETSDYTFSKSILWLFLLIIPISVLAYFGYTNKELLFGKKSFDDISIKNATHRIEDPKPKEIKKPVADSLQSDSMKVAPQNINNQ